MLFFSRRHCQGYFILKGLTIVNQPQSPPDFPLGLVTSLPWFMAPVIGR